MLLEGIYMIYIFKIGVQNDGAITNRVGKQIQENITLLLINVLPSWALEPQLDNADARMRRLPISLLIHTAGNRSKILNTN